MREVLAASFAEVNANGGIYNRQLELKTRRNRRFRTSHARQYRTTHSRREGFCDGGSVLAGAEKEVVPLLAEQEVPVVGPLSLDPKIGAPLNRQVFYLTSGNSGQARALIDFVAKQPETKNQLLGIVYAPSELNTSVFESVKSQAQKDGLRIGEIVEYAGGSFDAVAAVTKFKATNTSLVLFLGNTSDLAALMTEAEKGNWYPQILLQSGGFTASCF